MTDDTLVHSMPVPSSALVRLVVSSTGVRDADGKSSSTKCINGYSALVFAWEDKKIVNIRKNMSQYTCDKKHRNHIVNIRSAM